MTLRLYNTLTRTKEPFRPIDDKNVRMYVCGPTVYDFAHIGNARPVIVFDVLFRLLRHLYGESHVTYVRNITDVDDKINARALRDYPDLPLNDAIRKVTETTANQFHSDVKALGCLEPTVEPRATDNIQGMVDMINLLLKNEHAYIARGSEGREALFDVSSMDDYGQLSGRKQDEQLAGARVTVEPHKKNPADFVLWKESGVTEPGWTHDFIPVPRHGYEAEFTISKPNQTALGLNSNKVTIHGRPGWHIECSEMSRKYLGKEFDIHGGGLDLIFPHHENEIAQSRCAHDTKIMAKVWMHNGFLQVEGQKMSKSLGNFRTLDNILVQEATVGAVVRLAMLENHYRDPIDWTQRKLHASKARLLKWFNSVRNLMAGELADERSFFWTGNPKPSGQLIELLSDDLNTPEALKWIDEKYTPSLLSTLEGTASLFFDLRFLGLLDRASFNYGVPIGGDWDVEDGPEVVELASRYQVAVANTSRVESSIKTTLNEKGYQISNDYLVFYITPTGTKITHGKTVTDLIAARLEARKAKNWAESDRIRDELAAMGVSIKDNKDGTTSWEVKS